MTFDVKWLTDDSGRCFLIRRSGKYSELLRTTDHGGCIVDGCLSPSTAKIFRTLAAEPPQNHTFFALIAGRGVEGTKEIAG